jgi:hypothetical protein
MLAEIDYDTNIFNPGSRDADKNLAVRFYTAPMQNEAKTLEAGRPIFDDTEMVEIRVRGDRNNVVQRPTREDDRRRFRDAYNEFKSGAAKLDSGTPLAQWPIMSQSMVEELRYFGFYTVEQLSKADDSACSKMNGLATMKAKALIYLEHAAGGSPIEKLQEDNVALKNRLEVADRNCAELATQLEKLTTKFETLAAKAGK